MTKMKKIPENPNRFETYRQYLKETNREVVKQGEFLWWVFHGKKTLKKVLNVKKDYFEKKEEM